VYVKEITMEPRRLEKLSDMRQEKKYLEKMNTVPTAFKKYSVEEQDLVREKVTQLPSEELVVIYLSFWENLCEYEIAKSICSTAARVLKVKQSALIHLRELMETDQKQELCIA
jgi:DNA-directed RNA polymerase specialized sigma24 family protein